MAFMRKIEGSTKQEVNQEEAREKFISGGGLVQADIIQEKKEIPSKQKDDWTRLLLRIRTNVLETIDGLVQDRMGMTRTGWILEAIQEKLKRENDQTL